MGGVKRALGAWLLLAAELEAAGYNVTRAALADESGYDLVAAKDNQRIAIEVKARSALRESADAIHRLREQARQHGYSEFRLVVVNPFAPALDHHLQAEVNTHRPGSRMG